MKQAVCILLRKSDKILGVARRHDHNDFGLSGGKVDDTDADPEDAIVRELQEETGLKVDRNSLIWAFDMVCKGGKDGIDYHSITYTADTWQGKHTQGDAGPVQWVTKEQLLAGSFGDYNRELFKNL